MWSKLSTHNLFKEFVQKAAEKFKSIDKRRTVRVISHIDSDGISAASILLSTLTKLKYRYSISFVKQLDLETVNELAKEDHINYIFTDLGSGQLKEIVSKFENKQVFILDHHIVQNAKLKENVVHINPMLFGIDGSMEISGSGVVYMFCNCINPKSVSMAHIALVGAIGDKQDKKKFSKLNNEILEEAIKEGKIKTKKGVRFFGRQTRPLRKLLEYCTDPYIPGVTGSPEGAIEFLNSLNIPFKRGEKNRKVVDLSEDEMKRLIKGIIKKRKDEKNPKDIFGTIYVVCEEELGSPLKDAKEFSTLLNACGRLGKASLGVGVCMGSKKSKEDAIDLLKSYKKEILSAIKWYEANKDGEDVRKGKGFIIINAKANIIPTLAGTLASILSYSSEMKNLSHFFVLAQNVDGTTKVSARYLGNDDKNVEEILKNVIKKVGGESGGHKLAAGAVIPTSKENDFIEKLENELKEH